MARRVSSLLNELEESKARVGTIEPAALRKLIAAVARIKFSDPVLLARFHDALMFLRAFPPDQSVLRQVDSLLAIFESRVARLERAGIDLSPIQDGEEFAGIVGTTLTTLIDYEETKWLVQRFPDEISIDWDGHEDEARLGASLPRFIPLLEEDAFVEPDVPYRAWIRAASGGHELPWLIEQFERASLSPDLRSEIFGALALPIRWRLKHARASRTLARRKARSVFFHQQPLIQRREVSLKAELTKGPLKLESLTEQAGQEIITMCREATTVRYRELYGTTRGDPTDVVRAQVGRGVEVFLWGLPAGKRLPLRAYQAGFTLKNGVPINYIEAISLFEWAEIGFNTFYAYRDGETAWIYSQVLRMLHQRLGVTCFSVYPYQIGKDNEEALASGAFWFYRKMGFRPMRKDLEQVAMREEAKIAKNSKYRTPLATLRRLAEGHVVYELPGSERGAWDGFRIRNIGFAIQRMMASRCGGDARRLRETAGKRMARALDVNPARWPVGERQSFETFAMVLALESDVAGWQSVEKSKLVGAIRAKWSDSDSHYALLLMENARFRKLIVAAGSEDISRIRQLDQA